MRSRAVCLPTFVGQLPSVTHGERFDQVELQSPDDESLPEELRSCSNSTRQLIWPLACPETGGVGSTLPASSAREFSEAALGAHARPFLGAAGNQFMQNIRWKPSPRGSLLIRWSFMRLGLLAGPRTQCVSPAGLMAFFVWHARAREARRLCPRHAAAGNFCGLPAERLRPCRLGFLRGGTWNPTLACSLRRLPLLASNGSPGSLLALWSSRLNLSTLERASPACRDATMYQPPAQPGLLTIGTHGHMVPQDVCRVTQAGSQAAPRRPGRQHAQRTSAPRSQVPRGAPASAKRLGMSTHILCYPWHGYQDGS